jgi:uncharacterized SAM-binding protein YcdF (DUF218 family)
MPALGSGPVREEHSPEKAAPPGLATASVGRRRRRLLRLAFIACFFGILVVARRPLLRCAGEYLDVATEPQQVDFVMVLGGDSEIRPFVAAALVKAGLARTVLVPRMKSDPEEIRSGSSEETMIQGVLRERGVSEKAILLLARPVSSTKDEALALAEFLDDHPDCTVAVVTSHYHTRRARWVFNKLLGDRAKQLHFVGAPAEGYDASNWWQSEAGFLAYMNEFVKLVYYRLSY